MEHDQKLIKTGETPHNFAALSDKRFVSECTVTRTDPRPAEGPNSFHWKNVKLEVLSCYTKFHEPHVVSEYVHF